MKEQEPIRSGLTNQAAEPTLGREYPMQEGGEVPGAGGPPETTTPRPPAEGPPPQGPGGPEAPRVGVPSGGERPQRTERTDPSRYFTDEELRAIRDNPVERERIFNDIFKRADVSPSRPFEDVFSQFYDLPVYTAFIDHLQSLGLVNEARKYIEEEAMRRIVHNANYAVLAGVGTEQLVNFVQGFRSELADLAFGKKGVVAAMHFHEQALLKVREENGGYLPYEGVVGDPKTGTIGRVEQLEREYLDRALRLGLIPGTEVRDEQGNVTYQMAEWEKNRAIAFAGGMGIITGRVIEIAASSILPKGETEANPKGSVGARFVSLYAQDVIRDIAPFRHVIGKFNVGQERNRILAFLLKRSKLPWSAEELRRFSWKEELDVINALAGDEKERYFGVLNPFRVGGLFSRTTWRLGDDPTVSGVAHLSAEDKEWIGTGVWIEKERGNLRDLNKVAPDEKESAVLAEQRIRSNLVKIANIQPLKLFFNVKELQAKVLGGLGKTMKDEELRGDLDMLVLLQEKAAQDRVLEIDLAIVEDAGQRQRIGELVRLVREEFLQRGGVERFIENLRDREWRLPFNFGTDDVPFDKYNFGRTGGTSLARRWRDIGSEKKAADALTGKLITGMDSFKKADDIIPVLREIYNGIAGYDEDTARQSILMLSEGIIKFYKKQWWSRLPAGFGALLGSVTGKASYAQIAFTRDAMAWDEIDVNEFKRKLRDQNMLTPEQEQELGRRTGGNKLDVAYGFVRTFAPLAALALLYYLSQRVLKEEPKK